MQIILTPNELDLAVRDYVRDRFAQPGVVKIVRVEFRQIDGQTIQPPKVVVEVEGGE